MASGTDRDTRAWGYVGAGCLTFFAGFFGGGMIGVFVGWIVGLVQRCRPPEGTFPICNIHPYWFTGMVLGAILLPTVTIWRLKTGDARSDVSSERGESGGTS